MSGRQLTIFALIVGLFTLAYAEAHAVDKYNRRQRRRAYYSEEAKAERERTVTYQTVCFERYLHKENVDTKEKTLVLDEHGQPFMCGDYERVIGDPVTEKANPDAKSADDSKSVFFFKDGKLREGKRE